MIENSLWEGIKGQRWEQSKPSNHSLELDYPTHMRKLHHVNLLSYRGISTNPLKLTNSINTKSLQEIKEGSLSSLDKTTLKSPANKKNRTIKSSP